MLKSAGHYWANGTRYVLVDEAAIACLALAAVGFAFQRIVDVLGLEDGRDEARVLLWRVLEHFKRTNKPDPYDMLCDIGAVLGKAAR